MIRMPNLKKLAQKFQASSWYWKFHSGIAWAMDQQTLVIQGSTCTKNIKFRLIDVWLLKLIMCLFFSQQEAWRSFLLVMEQKPRRALDKFTEPVYRAWLEHFLNIGECNLMCIKMFKKEAHVPWLAQLSSQDLCIACIISGIESNTRSGYYDQIDVCIKTWNFFYHLIFIQMMPKSSEYPEKNVGEVCPFWVGWINRMVTSRSCLPKKGDFPSSHWRSPLNPKMKNKI